MNALLVGIGGGIGSVLRYFLTLGASHPIAVVFAINISGAFLLGVVTMMTSGRCRLFLGTGILGGFTTYSAFAVDTVRLFHDDVVAGLLYPIGSVVAGILAAWLGMRCTTWGRSTPAVIRERKRRPVRGGPEK
ncbi:CrcB family protein [Trueperella pyogenes]|uniref:fluoride efflux transporter FluC n=1 Tax=Trueperella pyogenes TaxID=1661 RepID=UPI002167D63B|nr:CrcB family protein [Trueperella pyogenes]UVJ56522.1 CrcB family protein [Trueperella pyogenes]